ncbi:MAG: heparinase II/III family protein [Alphaproteobacteria bacterium]|nr:heparinase II/III family protein [Alphaproteobacteria bacterium]
MLTLLLLACRAGPDSAPPSPSDDSAPDEELVQSGPIAPELSGWPRLLAGPEERDALRARLAGEASEDPDVNAAFAWLGEQLRARCDATAPVPEADPYDYGSAWPAAAIARDCAFLAWIYEDAEDAAKAAEVLATIPADAFTLSAADYDVHLSTTLALSAQTLDLLRGAGLTDDLSAQEAVVYGLADTLYARYVVEQPLWFAVWQNNHNLKLAGALGQAALVFADEEASGLWASWALTELRLLTDSLHAVDGGYAEGPYYQQYGTQQTAPFMRAWHRLRGDTGERFAVSCDTRPPGTCEEGEALAVGDLWEDRLVRASWAWNLSLRMPSGDRPPVDDGTVAAFPSAMLAEVDPAYGWDWLHQDTPFLRQAGDVSAEIVSAWDGSVAEPALSPCRQSADSGYSILSTGLERDATWFMLLAEPDGVMTDNGHEHNDLGTIQLWARGAYLLPDAGYAGYTDREYTKEYAHHSGVMVDDEPPPTSASVFWRDSSECWATVEMSWEGVTWSRWSQLLGEVVVVGDSVDAPGAGHLTWRVHTVSGEGRGTLELRDWGAILRREDVSLVIAMTGLTGTDLSSARFSIDESLDALRYADLKTHEVLVVELPADRAQTLLALVPIDADAEPEVSVEAGAVIVDGVRYGS